jgi:hypothetical protein
MRYGAIMHAAYSLCCKLPTCIVDAFPRPGAREVHRHLAEHQTAAGPDSSAGCRIVSRTHACHRLTKPRLRQLPFPLPDDTEATVLGRLEASRGASLVPVRLALLKKVITYNQPNIFLIPRLFLNHLTLGVVVVADFIVILILIIIIRLIRLLLRMLS